MNQKHQAGRSFHLRFIHWLVIICCSYVPALMYAGTLFPVFPQMVFDSQTNKASNGETKLILPLMGGDAGFLFFGGAARYGRHQAWFGELGTGIRASTGYNIFSAYLFGNHLETQYGGRFWVMNPGLQWMNQNWDLTMNGYFPVTRTRLLDKESSTWFQGHSQYTSLFQQVEKIATGGDIILGRTFPHAHHVRVYVGGYYYYIPGIPSTGTSAVTRNTSGIFCPLRFSIQQNADNINTIFQHSNIYGGQIGVHIPLGHRFSLEIKNSYDNFQHDVFTFVLQWRLGGPIREADIADAPLEDRLVSPIPRHLGMAAIGSGMPSKIYTPEKAVSGTASGELFAETLADVWFFRPEGADPTTITADSCTYEHPCKTISTNVFSTIDTVASNANFYLNEGIYENPDLGDGFIFAQGQNVFGRMNDFCDVAEGDRRPLLNDTVLPSGNNNFYNLRIRGSSAGKTIFPFIQASFEILESAYGTTITLNNSELRTEWEDIPGTFTIDGIFIGANDVNLIVNNSTIFVDGTCSTCGMPYIPFIATSISNPTTSTVTINDSTVNTVNNTDGTQADGVFNAGTMIFNRSTVTATQNSPSGGGAAVGITQQKDLILNESTINAIQNGQTGASIGIDARFSENITMTHSSINATQQNTIDGVAIGIYKTASFPITTINFSDTRISANGIMDPTKTNAIDIVNPGYVILNDLGGNTCYENGFLAPCS